MGGGLIMYQSKRDFLDWEVLAINAMMQIAFKLDLGWEFNALENSPTNPMGRGYRSVVFRSDSLDIKAEMFLRKNSHGKWIATGGEMHSSRDGKSFVRLFRLRYEDKKVVEAVSLRRSGERDKAVFFEEWERLKYQAIGEV